MVQVILVDAEAPINVQRQPSSSFQIEREVRQGCFLAPFLFLIMGEALHAKVQLAQEHGRTNNVKLPKTKDQQLTLQFADDTSFTVRVGYGSISILLRILHSFNLASGLLINWSKSSAYWAGRNGPLPAWAHNFRCTWEAEGNISKLLGTPFGLSITTIDTNQFFIDKVKKKLTYWTSTKLSLAAKRLIVNQVLMSAL